MPYEVRHEGNHYCVYKKTGGASLGCHPSQGQAERQIAAILISEHGAGKKSLADGNAKLRLGLLITSNAYQDRTEEIIRQKALEDWVTKSWNGETFIGNNPLLFWHRGDPLGSIIYADTEGPFLIEVAQERPDQIVNLMPPGSPPIFASVKSVWDAFQEMDTEWGASHEFLYLKEDGEDGVYDQIVKTESTVLPRSWAANAYTLFAVI